MLIFRAWATCGYVNEKQNNTKTEINEKKKELLKKPLTQSIMEEDSIKECGNGKLNLQLKAERNFKKDSVISYKRALFGLLVLLWKFAWCFSYLSFSWYTLILCRLSMTHPRVLTIGRDSNLKSKHISRVTYWRGLSAKISDSFWRLFSCKLSGLSHDWACHMRGSERASRLCKQDHGS